MSESSDLRQRAKSAFQHAKQTVGVGDPPLATEVGGRVEAVREALRAFGAGDHDRFLAALGENVEWVSPRGENFPGSGVCEGRDAVRERFVEAVERSYTKFGFTPENYLESAEENVVIVVGAFGGQGVKGPSEFDAPAVQIWEFDGDKVVGVEIFADSDAFPEAVAEDEPQPGEEDEEDEDDAKSDGGGSDEDGEDEQNARSQSESDSPGKSDASRAADGESSEKSTPSEETGSSATSASADRGETRGDADSSSESESSATSEASSKRARGADA